MRKIYCNREFIITLVLSIFVILNVIFWGFLYKHPNILIIGIFEVVGSVILLSLSLFYAIKRYGKVIIISEMYIEYKDNKNTFKIPLNNIKKLTYNFDGKFTFTLNIIFNDEEEKRIELSEKDIKRVAKYINKDVTFVKDGEVVKSGYGRLSEVKEFIFGHKYRIVFGIIGVFTTVLFMFLYHGFEDFILNIFLCVLAFVCAFGQIFFVYLNKYSFGKRITFSLILPIIFSVVIFLFLWFGLENIFSITDTIFYSILVLPAFAIITLLILLIG